MTQNRHIGKYFPPEIITFTGIKAEDILIFDILMLDVRGWREKGDSLKA